MTKDKSAKDAARKRQQRLMKKRTKDAVRHRSHSSGSLSENAIQHQMLSEFGSVENFVKNLHHLSAMLRDEEELKRFRFDAGAIYAKLDAADPDMNAALADLYSNDDYAYYAEEHEHFWKEKRGEILPEIIKEEFVQDVAKTFKVLLQKKRGFKKEYRAALAGNLLVQSHIASLKESPIGENNLWELIFNATLKENKIELPTSRERATPAAEEGEPGKPESAEGAPATPAPETPMPGAEE